MNRGIICSRQYDLNRLTLNQSINVSRLWFVWFSGIKIQSVLGCYSDCFKLLSHLFRPFYRILCIWYCASTLLTNCAKMSWITFRENNLIKSKYHVEYFFQWYFLVEKVSESRLANVFYEEWWKITENDIKVNPLNDQKR